MSDEWLSIMRRITPALQLDVLAYDAINKLKLLDYICNCSALVTTILPLLIVSYA
jgi:hypothetical protein